MAMFNIAPVTPEELECKAEAARSLKDQYDQILVETNDLFHTFDGRVKFDALNAFMEKFDSMQLTLNTLSDMMEWYAKMADTSAKALREIEEMEKSGRSDLFGCIHD